MDVFSELHASSFDNKAYYQTITPLFICSRTNSWILFA